MTWFQLVDSVRSDPEPVRSTRLAPNSALFLNPTLALQPADNSAFSGASRPGPTAVGSRSVSRALARPSRRHLRLVKDPRCNCN